MCVIVGTLMGKKIQNILIEKMKKNILILGASSDIGIELIKFLIKKEYNITAHCNQNFKQLHKLKK